MNPNYSAHMTTNDDIAAVAAAQPALGNYGFDMELPLTADAGFLAQVNAARRFILDAPSAGVEMVSRGAYYLKHQAERHAQTYVSVGALIVGAMLEGLKPIRDTYGPNCRFTKA